MQQTSFLWIPRTVLLRKFVIFDLSHFPPFFSFILHFFFVFIIFIFVLSIQQPTNMSSYGKENVESEITLPHFDDDFSETQDPDEECSVYDEVSAPTDYATLTVESEVSKEARLLVVSVAKGQIPPKHDDSAKFGVLAEKWKESVIETEPLLSPMKAVSHKDAKFWQHIPRTEFDCDLEIVGLCNPCNGRSCTVHECCGEDVRENDIVRLVRTTITAAGNLEAAVKIVLIQDGADTCTVAYVPRIYMNLPIVERNINRFAVIKELYDTSDNEHKRNKSSDVCGMASICFLDEIPMDE
jgi:hypothetical protein